MRFVKLKWHTNFQCGKVVLPVRTIRPNPAKTGEYLVKAGDKEYQCKSLLMMDIRTSKTGNWEKFKL